MNESVGTSVVDPTPAEVAQTSTAETLGTACGDARDWVTYSASRRAQVLKGLIMTNRGAYAGVIRRDTRHDTVVLEVKVGPLVAPTEAQLIALLAAQAASAITRVHWDREDKTLTLRAAVPSGGPGWDGRAVAMMLADVRRVLEDERIGRLARSF